MLIWIQPDHCPADVRELIERDEPSDHHHYTESGECIVDGRIVARIIDAREEDGAHEDLLGALRGRTAQESEIAELHALLDRRDQELAELRARHDALVVQHDCRDQELAELRARHDALVVQHVEVLEELRLTRGALDALGKPEPTAD